MEKLTPVVYYRPDFIKNSLKYRTVQLAVVCFVVMVEHTYRI
jgi:hypothetical protein